MAFDNKNIKEITPTEGFNLKVLNIEGVALSVWDLGGQKELRKYWSNYYEKTHAIIYVIDSADEDRVEEAGKEMQSLLSEKNLEGVPLLVFANK